MARILVVSRNAAMAMGLSATDHEVVDLRPSAFESWMEQGDRDLGALVLDLIEPAVALDAVTRLRARALLAPALLVSSDVPGWDSPELRHLPAAQVLPLPISRPALLSALEDLLSGSDFDLHADQPPTPVTEHVPEPEPVPEPLLPPEPQASLPPEPEASLPPEPASEPEPEPSTTADAEDEPPAPGPTEDDRSATPHLTSQPLHVVDDDGDDYFGTRLPDEPEPRRQRHTAAALGELAGDDVHLDDDDMVPVVAPHDYQRELGLSSRPELPVALGSAPAAAAAATLTAPVPVVDPPAPAPRKGRNKTPIAPSVASPPSEAPKAPAAAAAAPEAPAARAPAKAHPRARAPRPVETTISEPPPSYFTSRPDKPPKPPKERRFSREPAKAAPAEATERTEREAAHAVVAVEARIEAGDNATLVRRLLERVGELYGLPETADVVIADAVERGRAEAGALLVPDEGSWRVSGGVNLRALEHRYELRADSWLVLEIARGHKGAIIEDTDIARQPLQGAPLASWKHLLATPVPLVEGIVLLARSDDPFTEDELMALAALGNEAGPLLATAAEVRRLARSLDEYRDEIEYPR